MYTAPTDFTRKQTYIVSFPALCVKYVHVSFSVSWYFSASVRSFSVSFRCLFGPFRSFPVFFGPFRSFSVFIAVHSIPESWTDDKMKRDSDPVINFQVLFI